MSYRSLILKISILLLFIFVSLSSLMIQDVSAATDAVQVNLSVTAGSSNPPPSGGGGGPTPIPGCTNPLATNYNSSATTDDGSCVYAPPPETIPNVSNFTATMAGDSVALVWQNPSYPDLAAVRIVRGTNTVPVNPTDGSLIYNEIGENVEDSSVSPGTQYYYVAFVRSTAGDYSSGTLASILTPTQEEPLPEPEEEPSPDEEPPPGEEPPPDDSGSPGSGTGTEDLGPGSSVDPFANLPQVLTLDPITQLLELGDFIFYQPGERQQFFQGNADVKIIGQKPLAVMIASKKLPAALKTIGLTIINPVTKKPFGTYLLKANADGTSYTASLGSTFPNGVYPLFISIINYRDQTIKRLVGRLIVTGGLPETALERAVVAVGQIISPVAVTMGLVTGLTQGLALADRVNSAYDLYLILLHGWSFLLRGLGLRRRAPPWGIVYDSVTKRPLDPAYVIVRQNDNDKGTAITDLDGRYGFFLSSGTYNLVANKTHYQFPSKKLAGRKRDELYNNLYFGEPVTTIPGEIINRNIPLDPIAFDWNEFAKQARGFFILHSRHQARRRGIFNVLYAVGFLTGIYNFVFHPGKLSIVILALYLITFFAKYFINRTKRQALSVKHPNGEPIPFAIVRAFIPDVDQEVKSVVADMMGRFFLLTPPGRYYITVDEKLPDETYKRIYQSPPRELKNGVLTEDLIV
ncbi:MAG TPA: hypothetical protein VJB69_00360 [Candidatus Paceibacterota bacterium]